MTHLQAFLLDDGGSTLTEYAVISASFAIFWMIGMLTVIGESNSLLTSIFNGQQNIQLCPPGTAGC